MVIDKGMNALLGYRWQTWKQEKAASRAMEALTEMP
jgi:hypothetical protein